MNPVRNALCRHDHRWFRFPWSLRRTPPHAEALASWEERASGACGKNSRWFGRKELAVNLLICHWILFWPSCPFSLTDCFWKELPFRGLCRWPSASRSTAAVQVSQCSFQRTLFWKAPGPKPECRDFPTEKVRELVGYNDTLWFKKYTYYTLILTVIVWGGSLVFVLFTIPHTLQFSLYF